MRRRLVTALKWLLALGLLAFLLSRVDVAGLARSLAGADPGPILLSLVAFSAGIALHTWRWHLLLVSRGARLGFLEAGRLVLGGHFFNLFLPGTLGGDAYRAYASRPAAASLLQSSGLVLIERYCGFLATFLMALAALAVSDFSLRQPVLAALVVVLFLAFLAPLPIAASRRVATSVERVCRRFGWPRVEHLVKRIHAAARRVAAEPRLIVAVIVLSLGMKFSTVVVIYLLALALGLPVGAADLLVFLPIHTVVSALPISINGLGVREANTVAFFTQLGMTDEQATSLAMLVLVWVYVTALPGGLVLLMKRRLEG